MTNEQRERLVESHIPLALSIAAKQKQRYPKHIEMDEFISLAYVGLAEAGRRYDPAKGCAFATLAIRRITGSIQDGFKGRNYPHPMNYIDSSDQINFHTHTVETAPACEWAEDDFREIEKHMHEHRYYQRISELLREAANGEVLVRILLLRLDHKTPTQIGKCFGMSRTWAYTHLREIRAILQQHAISR